MNDNVVNFEGLRVKRLLLSILGVILSQDDGDLAQLGPAITQLLRMRTDEIGEQPVDTVGGGGNVPVVEQDPSTLIAADADVGLPWQLRKLGLLPPDNALGKLSVSRETTLGLVIKKLLLPAKTFIHQ